MGIPGNKRANHLAKARAKKRSITPLPKTIAHIARQHKAELKETWTFWWTNTLSNLNSGFHAVNKRPPMTIPSDSFQSLDCKTFSQLIQFKTGHTHIGEYYKGFVPSEEQACQCGA